MIGTWIEPMNQPMANGVAIHAMGFNAGVRQAAHQAIADDFQVRTWCLASHIRLRALGTAVDNNTDAALLAPPGQLADLGVFKQPAWFGDGFQVLLHQLQIKLGECTALCAWLNVVMQLLKVIVPAGFVLGIELNHPG